MSIKYEKTSHVSRKTVAASCKLGSLSSHRVVLFLDIKIVKHSEWASVWLNVPHEMTPPPLHIECHSLWHVLIMSPGDLRATSST